MTIPTLAQYDFPHALILQRITHGFSHYSFLHRNLFPFSTFHHVRLPRFHTCHRHPSLSSRSLCCCQRFRHNQPVCASTVIVQRVCSGRNISLPLHLCLHALVEQFTVCCAVWSNDAAQINCPRWITRHGHRCCCSSCFKPRYQQQRQ